MYRTRGEEISTRREQQLRREQEERRRVERLRQQRVREQQERQQQQQERQQQQHVQQQYEQHQRQEHRYGHVGETRAEGEGHMVYARFRGDRGFHAKAAVPDLLAGPGRDSAQVPAPAALTSRPVSVVTRTQEEEIRERHRQQQQQQHLTRQQEQQQATTSEASQVEALHQHLR